MTEPEPITCAVPNCPYALHEAGLCRKHWHQVPLADRLSVPVLAAAAVRAETERQHEILRRRLIETLR